MGEFKELFNWNNFSQMYYLAPIGQRFLVGLVLGAGNISFAAGIVSAAVILAQLIIVAKKKPYCEEYHNIRSIFTSVFGLLILAIYVALSANGPSMKASIYTYFPYAIIGIVVLNILMSLGFIILEFVRKGKRNSKEK